MEQKKQREKKDFHADEILTFRSEGNKSMNKSAYFCQKSFISERESSKSGKNLMITSIKKVVDAEGQSLDEVGLESNDKKNGAKNRSCLKASCNSSHRKKKKIQIKTDEQNQGNSGNKQNDLKSGKYIKFNEKADVFKYRSERSISKNSKKKKSHHQVPLTVRVDEGNDCCHIM